MRLGGHIDDSRRSRSLEPIQQKAGEDKWREMVDCEGQLEPVERKSVSTRHQPGVVDKQIDPVVSGKDLASQAAHFAKARKIGEEDLDLVAAGALPDKPTRRLGPRAVATDHDDPHAGMSKTERGIKPDPGAGSGNDCDPCGSVGVTRH